MPKSRLRKGHKKRIINRLMARKQNANTFKKLIDQAIMASKIEAIKDSGIETKFDTDLYEENKTDQNDESTWRGISETPNGAQEEIKGTTND